MCNSDLTFKDNSDDMDRSKVPKIALILHSEI